MRPLLLASVAVIVIAVAAPGLMTRYLEPSDAARTATAPAVTRSGAAGVSRVTIAASGDGHFYVDAEINLRPIRLVVDTGATAVALRASDAAAVGIRPRPADFDQPVATANGTAHAARAELDSVVVEDVEVSGVRALVLPDEQLSVSLLGGSFLNRLARYRVEDGTLVLEN